MRTTPPPQPLGLEPSFGFGDRLGDATPGHVAALTEAGRSIRGVFAQQSIREMQRTGRTPEQVMDAAVGSLRMAGYTDHWGADADHLKTEEDIRLTMNAGFVFYTLDPSDCVDQSADDYSPEEVSERFTECREDAPWVEDYLGKTLRFVTAEIVFDELTLQRAAVKYGRAIKSAIRLGQFVQEQSRSLERPFEIELSVDETEQPTTLGEHFVIADQMRRAGVEIASLAPRFVGEFEKGVDFKGDLTLLEQSLEAHAEIAEALGPYKLSLHSGSDKLSMYPALARATKDRFHVKTAGTSYLEAIRVAARKAPELFARIIDFSRDRYDGDKATYHVSATLDHAPATSDVSDVGQLERLYLERWEDVPRGKGFTAPGRQILHCTFGSVLTDGRLGSELKELLRAEADEYTEILKEHFVRHLDALCTR